jgi:uncharacterized protein (TIGR01777 family)
VKRVLITGGSGFIGRSLARELLARGDHVTVLTRDVTKTRRHMPREARVTAWSPDKLGPWVDELSVIDAVVHLAGESVAQRWTDAVKRRIEQSRIGSTKVLVEAIGKATRKPSVLVCASAVGYYGAHPGEVVLDESSPAGQGFLADVVKRWEESAREVEALGVRSVQVRIGVVLGEGGGALDKMVTPFKLYAGGPIADGKQVVSWVHRDDVVGILLVAIDNGELKGPINAVSPNAVTSNELAEGIGIVVNKPSWLRVPKAAIELGMGEAAEILTKGQRVFPKRAVELGYEFRYARLIPALESILGKDQ